MQEVTQAKVSSQGYKLVHYEYDDNGNCTRVWTEYVHEGEVYEGPISKTYDQWKYWLIKFPPRVTELEYHEVESPRDE